MEQNQNETKSNRTKPNQTERKYVKKINQFYTVEVFSIAKKENCMRLWVLHMRQHGCRRDRRNLVEICDVETILSWSAMIETDAVFLWGDPDPDQYPRSV